MNDLLKLNEEFSEEERLIQQSVRSVCEKYLEPLASLSFEKDKYPVETIQHLASLGIFGMNLPDKFGLNLSKVAYGIVCEELERVDSAFRSFVSVQNSLVMFPIFKFGSEEQKNYYLPKLASGDFIGCFCLTEPDHGSDPESMETKAQKIPEGWLINGTKTWITNAPIADIAIVWAKTEDGIRGFIVESKENGLLVNTIKGKMSLKASETGEVIFDNVIVAKDKMLPGSKIGIIAALSCLTQARFGIGWGAIGAASACYETALKYTLERKQFNKQLASFQLVQKDLVNMYEEIIKARALNLFVGKRFDQSNEKHILSSLIKKNSSKVALCVARKARDLLGANGITLEYKVIRHMLNLETVYTYEGTDNIHTLLLGKYLTGIKAISN